MKRGNWNTPGFIRVNSSFTPDFNKLLNTYCRKHQLNRSKFIQQACTALMLHQTMGTTSVPILGTAGLSQVEDNP